MEGDISEHNAIKLKYHTKKGTSNFFLQSLCELMTGIKKSITTINVIGSAMGTCGWRDQPAAGNVLQG